MRTVTSRIALLGIHALLGCSSSEPGPGTSEGELLAPPEAGTGVQYRMVSTLAPGQEIERCQLFVVPPEGLNVQRELVRYSGGSHHVLLYRTAYKELPTETRRGEPIDGTTIHDCNDGPQADWHVTGVVGGSQSAGGASFLGALPEGMALKVEPGAVLLMNTHYVNTSGKTIETDARINLYTIPDDEVETEAGMLFHYNMIISVPARGESSARMRCTAEQDFSVVRIQSHMHRRGVGYVAHKVDSDGEMTELYAHENWEDVPSREFSPFLELKAGEALDYRCDFQNTEDRNIAQGVTSRDEMCMLIGPYFPRSQAYENCASEEGFYEPTWFGAGSATCAEALVCLRDAAPLQEDGGFESHGCVVNSCAAAGPALSKVITCQSSLGFGACKDVCNEGAEACATCVGTACAEEREACEAATCD